jgi:hypothetical protein
VDVEGLLTAEEAGWRALHATFDRLTPGLMERPGLTDDGWTAKDLVFHVGAWLAECGLQLERIRMGTYTDPDQDTDELNRRFVEISRTMDLDTVFAELHAARNRALQAFGELPEVTPDAWEWFEESGPLHYEEHRKELEAWADQLLAG